MIIEANGYDIEFAKPKKVLIHPELTKQDFVDYYKKVAKRLITYSKGRPLSMLRFPNGFPGNSFFQRNRPKWAPEWIQHKELGVFQKADYIIVENTATLIWLVNLGALEFHVAQVSAPKYGYPDILVFDLDPPPNAEFSEIRDFAIGIKPMIESFGYTCFVKTSGKSGIHIYCPINPRQSFDNVFEAANEIGEYIIANVSGATLKISKKERQHKILVDIYRNHSYQSMIMPYSIRATSSASVSMPLTWKELKEITTPSVFTIHTVPEWVKTHNDPWEKLHLSRIALHR